MANEAAHVTRTEPGGDEAAVLRRSGRRSWVKRKGPRQLVPSWRSWPYVGVEVSVEAAWWKEYKPPPSCSPSAGT